MRHQRVVTIVALLIFILGLLGLVNGYFRVKYTQPPSGRPRNLTKKAPVLKKTYKWSSRKNCYAGDGVKVQENARIPIFLYHYVENVKDKKDKIRIRMNISPNTFDKYLETFFNAQYTTVFVKEVPQILQGEPFGCMPAVALTFDDGYEDFYTDVFPILKKYDAKATVYIISDFIGKKGYLNAQQIRELIQSGLVEIGSHTKDHSDLFETSVAQSREQIIDSKRALEDEFGISIETFSYPYGHYKPQDLNLVKEASYSAAVTVSEGVIHSKGEMYTLKRVRPEKFLDHDLIKELEAYQK